MSDEHSPEPDIGAQMGAAAGSGGSTNGSNGRPLLVGALIAVTIVLAVVMTSSGDDDDAGRAAPSNLGPVEVRYEVTGTADTIDITIETPSGTSQQAGLGVPLKRKTGETGLIARMPLGEFVYISAQNQGESGTVTCRIVASDGSVIAENTSSGAYTIASCDGRAR